MVLIQGEEKEKNRFMVINYNKRKDIIVHTILLYHQYKPTFFWLPYTYYKDLE